jgi:PAS domain S-box-containing protein
MIEAVVDYAIYMLDPDGRIMSWNTGARRVKGYSESEVIGRHYSMFFPEEAVRAGKPKQELERARLEGRFEEEGWRLRKLGPPFWANVVLTPVYEHGVLRGYVKTIIGVVIVFRSGKRPKKKRSREENRVAEAYLRRPH